MLVHIYKDSDLEKHHITPHHTIRVQIVWLDVVWCGSLLSNFELCRTALSYLSGTRLLLVLARIIVTLFRGNHLENFIISILWIRKVLRKFNFLLTFSLCKKTGAATLRVSAIFAILYRSAQISTYVSEYSYSQK